MDVVITPSPHPVSGALLLPADKAICHRAALVCALTQGSTEITPWSSADDCQRTLEVLQQLGVRTTRTGEGIRVQGVGLKGLQAPHTDLFCGDSGTTMRLTAGLVAGQPFVSRLTADASLSRRPMRRIVEPLSHMGAQFEGVTRSSQEVYPPLVIRGQRPLRGFTYAMPLASAQVKSAILLAGVFAERPVTIIEPIATRDHTERLLKRLGVSMRCTDCTITLEPPLGEIAAPDQLVIPGDLSSAAFFVVAAVILPDSHVVIREVSLNPSRRHFLDVLTRMGAAIRWEVEDDGWEPRGTLTVTYKPLHGMTVAASEVPLLIDELPILMVAACAAEGQSRFEGLGELRVKEADRLRAMVMGLQRLGAQVEFCGDAGVVITHSRLQGTSVDSVQDHRTAMSLAIAGLVAEGQTRIQGAECVGKSLGNFFELLSSLTGPSVVKTVA